MGVTIAALKEYCGQGVSEAGRGFFVEGVNKVVRDVCNVNNGGQHEGREEGVYSE